MAPVQRKRFDMKFKLSVVKYAEETSGEAAARHFSIDPKRVRVWRKTKSELLRRSEEDSGKARLPGGGRKRASEELEANLRDWVISKQARHEKVSRNMIKAMAKETYATVSDRRDEEFAASTGWLNRFLHRNNFTHQRSTTMARKKARESTERLVKFLMFSSQTIEKKKIADRDVIAMDETVVWFDVGGATESTGPEKMHLTVVLAAKADGTKLKPFLVFKGGVGEVEATQSVNGAVIASSKDGWTNDHLTVEWLQKVVGKSHSHHRLLVWDSDPCHVSRTVKEELKRGYGITMALIPAGCTEYVQPADLVWTRSFNASLHQSYQRWTDGDAHETYEVTGDVRAPARHLLVAWVLKAWEEVDTELVKESFKVCGLTLEPDGSEDHLISCFQEGEPCAAGRAMLDQARRGGQEEEGEEEQQEEEEIENGVSDFTSWTLVDLKQEKEEEEEQPVSQREPEFTYRIVKEEDLDPDQDQDPGLHADDLVKREEPDSPAIDEQEQTWFYLDIKKEEEEEEPVSQTAADLLDSTDQNLEQHPEDHVGEGEPDSTNNKQKKRTRKGRKQHHCQFCKKAFTTSAYLKIHQKIHTGEDLHGCDQCGKTFATNRTLRDHRLTHTGQKPYGCELCGETFTQDSRLRSHRLVHTGQKAHTCEQCGKTFIKDCNLQRHLRIHTGEKPHWCDQCGKTFTTDSHLKCHERIHTGEKPYFCELCGKVHQHVHAGEKLYWCEQCGKSFPQSSHPCILTGEITVMV